MTISINRNYNARLGVCATSPRFTKLASPTSEEATPDAAIAEVCEANIVHGHLTSLL